MLGFGRGTFNSLSQEIESGEYAIIVYGENMKIKKHFTVLDKICCDKLRMGDGLGSYVQGDTFELSAHIPVKTSSLAFNLISSDGKIIQSKEIAEKDIDIEVFSVFELSIDTPPGPYTLEVNDGKSVDSVPLHVIPFPDELRVKYPEPGGTMALYDLAVKNNEPGYDVLLAASLEPFAYDGRQYIIPARGLPEHHPCTQSYT